VSEVKALPREREELIRYLKEHYVTEEVAGVLYVRPERVYLAPEILEYKVTDTTPIIRNFRQKVVRSYVHRNIESFKLYGISGIFRKVCTMYRDPVIKFDILPVKTTNVVFHMFSWRITGEIVNRFVNNSESGEIGTTKVFRLRVCPSDPNAYTWEKDPRSSDLIPYWIHEFVEDSTGTYLDDIDQKLPRTPSGAKVEVKGSWAAYLGQIIFTLLEIFLTGRVVLRNGYDVTINYVWKDQTQTINRHVDLKVALPVEGGVVVAWD